MNLFKSCTGKPHSFLVLDATPASENPSHFRKIPLENTWKLIMTIDYIKHEKLQCDTNREAKKY